MAEPKVPSRQAGATPRLNRRELRLPATPNRQGVDVDLKTDGLKLSSAPVLIEQRIRRGVCAQVSSFHLQLLLCRIY